MGYVIAVEAGISREVMRVFNANTLQGASIPAVQTIIVHSLILRDVVEPAVEQVPTVIHIFMCPQLPTMCRITELEKVCLVGAPVKATPSTYKREESRVCATD